MATYHHISAIATPFPVPVSALAFDPVSDIVWAGSNSGNVAAFVGRQGLRSVAFRVGDLPVSKVVVGENYVRAGCNRGMGFGTWGKGGMNKWFYHSDNRSVHTFTSSTTSSNVIGVSIVGPELLLVSPATGTVVRQCQVPSLITHMEFSHSSLISAGADGYLRNHDPRTGITRAAADSSVRAHPSGIQGLQISGNYIFTIGLQSRQGRPFPDHLVKVFDARTMRTLPPVPFSAGPAFLNLVPRRSSSVAVASTQGSVTIVDAANLNTTPEFYQIDTTSYLTSLALSPTGAYMAFGDADGIINLMTQVDEDGLVPFNGFDGQPFEWPDTPAPLPDTEWTDSTPLNTIGMPHYTSQLLSSWSPNFVSSTPYYPPPQKIPSQILNSMKTNDNVAYATVPKELRGKRNVVATTQRKPNARFRSGKTKTSENEPETPVFDTGEEAPKMYRKVEIEYSKFGVEDFDFGFYNKTEYSGLETHILNSYTNSMLQAMHYSRPIRQLAKSHIAIDCNREHCLLCELGFVVRMLEDARGTNCQSSNFCKTVGVLAQASNSIDLIDYGRESNEVDHSHMIQSFHRFLIDHLSAEGNSFPHNPVLLKVPGYVPDSYNPAAAPITQLMGIDAKNRVTCVNCKAVRTKENVTHIIDLIYPRKTISNEIQPPSDFASILRDSLLRQMTHKATCQSCKHFGTFSSRRSIASKDLPPILALNACLNSDETLKIWMDKRNQTFLQPCVELQGQVEGEDDPEKVTYELRAMIVEIITVDKHSHLVAIVKVPEAETSSDYGSPWYLFNDFVVRNISEQEALSFPNKWKVPAVLHFERVDLRDVLDFSELPVTLDASILSRDTSISMNRDPNLIKHEPLRYDELPTPGTLVAIDAEFVSMQQEETEYRSDGTKKVIRPARLSLARVSVLRGDGPKQAVPFIDDHIHTSETIVDYLTEFSGIRFGDLDLVQSPYTLTPLKVVYKKLRLLVDSGCIFIGHGLSKDFRIINIFVPPDQVIDTVDLYFVKARQRRLSLRFLSWFDARSALDLYKAYHQFEEQGIFDAKLEELYKEGRQYNFKPPVIETATPAVPQPLANPFPLDITLDAASLAKMFSSGHNTPTPLSMQLNMNTFLSNPNLNRTRGREDSTYSGNRFKNSRSFH
ncbi:PAB-dependent poly-A-specific ribonuclease subunit PAN2 [Mucidula mucida]|nr:PAB-dependent poly-A-specific ribonuclease subunit PAN2 [Mucidula mucida]